MGSSTILTRSPAGNRRWAAFLARIGLETYSLPTIDTRPFSPTQESSQTLARLKEFDWVVFTSAAGVYHTNTLLATLGIEVAGLKTSVAAIGKKTAAAAHEAGLSVAFQPSRATSSVLGAELTPVKNRKILLLRTSIASEELSTALRQRGAIVTDLAVYRTQLRTDHDPAFTRLLESGRIHCLTFASPSAVHGFSRRLKPDELQTARTLPAIAIGPSVAEALSEAGFSQIHIAAEPTIGSVAEAILGLSKPI